MNDELKANFFNLLGNYHIKKSDKDSVKTCYDLALNHALITRNNRIISSAYTNYAIYNFDIDLNLSLQYFDSSLLFAKKSLFTDRISESLYNIGFWYYSVNELDNAILNFEQSFFYASENSSYSNMIDAKEELLTIYRDLENWDKVDQIHLQILNIKNQQFKELIDAMNEIENFEIAFNSIKSPENSNNAESVFSSQSVIISLFAIVVIQLTLIIILVKKLMS
jgi:tetratricopeptide (TPR) repeat protein